VIGMAIMRCVQSLGDVAEVAKGSDWLEREAVSLQACTMIIALTR
jgi:hypothetical protein